MEFAEQSSRCPLHFLYSNLNGVRDRHRLQLLGGGFGGETGDLRPYGTRVTEFGSAGTTDGPTYVQTHFEAKD